MTFAEKFGRLIDESGWSRAHVAERIGRKDSQVVLARWLGKTDTGKPNKPKKPKFRLDGTPYRDNGPQPQPQDLLAIADLFAVDVRWLIDDSLGWEDRIRSDNPVLTRIRRLTVEDQLDMWEWFSARRVTEEGSRIASASHPKERPPLGPATKGETRSGVRSATK